MASSIWSPISGGITAPKGFKASGIRAGLKTSDSPDLALLLAPQGAVCAGTFTQSLVRASCVELCIERLQSNISSVRAVLVNSGHANACTGDRGLIDSLKATKAVSDQLGLSPGEILMCSTGVIGIPIPIDNLLNSIEVLIEQLSEEGGSSAAKAILTTDLVPKEICLEANFDGRIVRIGGMAKGSGMIHPNMATMLGYVTCDASIPKSIWELMIQKSVENSFNVITVDGDTSTNDSFLAFSSGEPLLDKFWNQLQNGLNLVTQYLAKAIARDGEGANCLIEVQVEGALNINDAREMARTIAGSSLVKTAIHGSDPNWGRILAAAGRSGIDFEFEKFSLWLGSYQLLKLGKPCLFNKELASAYIKQKLNGTYLENDSVILRIDLGSGISKAFAWGCDLSNEYIRINSDYTT